MILQRTSKKILIVDDDLITRLQLNKILKTHGYHVRLAENGHQCLEYLKKQRPKIILLDVVMPDLNGIEVCRRIKTDHRLKDIPVLMLTSASETSEKVSGLAAGADDYIVKPFVVEELMARIANHVKTANLVGRLKREVAHRKGAEIELEKAKAELETRVQMRTSELEFANEKLIQERRQLEQTQVALRERERRFEAVVNNIPGMVYKGYPDWSAKIFSGCMALCGYSEKEINDREDNWLSVIHPDDKDAIFEKGYLLSQEPQRIVQTYRIINKNGNICWVEDRKASLFSEDGVFLGIFGIVFDITERKQVEQRLKKSKRRFKNLINTMNEGLVEVDQDWTMTFVNNRFSEMTGFSVDRLVGKGFQDLVSKEFKKVAQEELVRREEGYTGIYELELVRADGQKIYVLCSPNPSYDSEGKYLGGLGVVADITARRDAEQKLLREKEKLEEALVKIKTLSGLLPICANCKKIRDDKGYWNQIENYITTHSDVLFSHSICPDCMHILYPDINSVKGPS